MARARDTNFNESLWQNKWSYLQYYQRLTELSISMFDWQNVPETIDTRFLELSLFLNGQCVFFKDEELGYLALDCMLSGQLDVYRIPIDRTAFAVNGYQKKLTRDDSVIIWNNLVHTNSTLDVEIFAHRLYNIDRTIDVNIRAQKTPMLLQGNEKQILALKNLYMKYDGNQPVMYADKSFDPSALSVLTTDAPYVADKLYEIKSQIWNEALTYLGISNVNTVKRERMITDEVTRNLGGVIASRYSRLESRRQACEQINKMFGLDMTVDYREDFQQVTDEFNTNLLLENETTNGGGNTYE